MKKPFHTILLFTILAVTLGCAKKDTYFLITEQSIGPLTRTTPVSELPDVFVADSILQDSSALAMGKTSKIKVFARSGKHLLTLTPSSDSIPTIENVRIFDTRYQTEKGIGLSSTFGDIQKNYAIKKIVTTLNSVVVFPKESNLYFTIDKEELPTNLRYTTSNIEAVQIPAAAKTKYLMIGWE